jgi:aspartate/methionine/tyrosine aminotransferase
MVLVLNPNMAATEAPPVMEARRWVAEAVFPPDRPLINVSQAAPVEPPPEGMRRAIARRRSTIRARISTGRCWACPSCARRSRRAGGGVRRADRGGGGRDHLGLQPGLLRGGGDAGGAGDEVILPTPWYFNHKMWLDMSGIRTVPLSQGAGLLPDPEEAARLVTERTRAIVLVTPNNPGGVEYPADLVRAFRDLARARGLALILDETYRDFDARTGAPHDLFADPDWAEVLIHLYSFSKAYRLTGHRVGAIIASAARLARSRRCSTR